MKKSNNPFGTDNKPDWMDPETYLSLRKLSLPKVERAAVKAEPLAPLQPFSTAASPVRPTQVQIPSADVFSKLLEYLAARSRILPKSTAGDLESAATRM